MPSQRQTSPTDFLADRIELRPVSELRPYTGNARLHSSKQIRQIADSIRQFGFNSPVLIDGAGTVIAGHGRIEAAKQLELDVVPTICLSHLSEPERRAFMLADNKLADNGTWDAEQLSRELAELGELDLDFNLNITGFETAEIDLMLTDNEPVDVDEPPINIAQDQHAISKPGDLWLLGKHRLFCGDALDITSYEILLGSQLAQMTFCDPPYNVSVDGHVCGSGAIRHREFIAASGEMSPQDFTCFLTDAFKCLNSSAEDGAIHFVCMDWRHIGEITEARNQAGFQMKNLCVWNKTNGGMGSLYRSKHELVFVFKGGTSQHINNIALGTHGRYRTNVWDYPGMNTLGSDRDASLSVHPTVKPTALVADAILDCSHRGGLVLDPFVGSGTTILAAERTGRRAAAMDLDPIYVDVAIRRWQSITGADAIHSSTKLSFQELAVARMQHSAMRVAKEDRETICKAAIGDLNRGSLDV